MRLTLLVFTFLFASCQHSEKSKKNNSKYDGRVEFEKNMELALKSTNRNDEIFIIDYFTSRL